MPCPRYKSTICTAPRARPHSATLIGHQGKLHLGVGQLLGNRPEGPHLGSSQERLDNVGSAELGAHQGDVLVTDLSVEECELEYILIG